MTLPDLELASTARRQVNLAKVSASRLVVYCYPLTSQPGTPQPRGWDEIAGARGCTAEARDFSARHAEFTTLGVALFGLSTQTTAYQSEMVARLQVPFEVLSDEHLSFARALRLPTFTADGTTFIKRLTLVVRAQRIEHVFYPVFPPETHAQEVLAWLKSTTA